MIALNEIILIFNQCHIENVISSAPVASVANIATIISTTLTNIYYNPISYCINICSYINS